MTRYLPAKIAAGVSLDVTLSLADYTPAGWTLTAYLRGPDDIDLTATADGEDFSLGATGAETAAWSPGRYWYSLRVTDGVDTHEIDAGELTVEPDLAAAPAGYDGRDHARKMLEAVEAVLESSATLEQRSYTIAGRTLERRSVRELLQLRDQYAAKVKAAERAAAGGGLFGRTVGARF